MDGAGSIKPAAKSKVGGTKFHLVPDQNDRARRWLRPTAANWTVYTLNANPPLASQSALSMALTELAIRFNKGPAAGSGKAVFLRDAGEAPYDN